MYSYAAIHSLDSFGAGPPSYSMASATVRRLALQCCGTTYDILSELEASNAKVATGEAERKVNLEHFLIAVG